MTTLVERKNSKPGWGNQRKEAGIGERRSQEGMRLQFTSVPRCSFSYRVLLIYHPPWPLGPITANGCTPRTHTWPAHFPSLARNTGSAFVNCWRLSIMRLMSRFVLHPTAVEFLTFPSPSRPACPQAGEEAKRAVTVRGSSHDTKLLGRCVHLMSTRRQQPVPIFYQLPHANTISGSWSPCKTAILGGKVGLIRKVIHHFLQLLHVHERVNLWSNGSFSL